MVKTGVFATEAEVENCKRLLREERQEMVVKVSGQWLPDLAHDILMRQIDTYAQAHGLPAPCLDADGDTIHYGLLATGEFTSVAPLLEKQSESSGGERE